MARARTLTLKTQVEVTGADKLNNLGKRMQSVGRNLTVGVTLPLAALGGAMVALAEDAARADAELSRTFESMGAGAWTTVDALKAQQKELQGLTTFGDEEISHLQSVLLTFGNVTGESFDRATAAALDMSTLLGQDLQSSAVQLGKALNDPIRGVTALRRVGVSFNEQQLEQIRLMTEAGNVAAAQGIILEEVERQFGGAAEAMAQTAGGQLKQALNELGDAGEEFGAVLAPVIKDIAGAVREFAKWLKSLNPETKEWVIRIGALLAVMGPLLTVVGTILRPISTLWRLFAAKDAAAGVENVARGLGRLNPALGGLAGPIAGAVAGLAAVTIVGEDLHRRLAPVEHEFNELASQVGLSRVAIEGEVNTLAQSLGVSADTIREQLTNALGSGASWDEAVDLVKDGGKQIIDATAEATDGIVTETSRTLRTARVRIVDAAQESLGDPIIEALLGGKEEAERIASETPGAIAQALIDNQFSVENASASLAQAAEDALHPLIERAQIIAFLASDELQQGLASGIPAVAQRARELRDAATSRLSQLGIEAWGWGNSVGTSFAAGMNAAYGYVRTAAGNLAAATRNQIGINSEPKDRNSPLYGLTKWGGNLAKTYAEGILSGLSVVSRAASALAAAVVPAGGFHIPGVAPVASASPGAGPSVVNNFYLTFTGEAPATSNAEELISQLQRLSPLISGNLG